MLLAGLLDGVHGENWIPIIAIGGGCLIAIVSILASAVKSAKETADLTALKRDMVAQGRPTDEIERVCNAGIAKKS